MVDHQLLYPLFHERFGESAGAQQYFSPGRVNLIGEHIDYNGGYVLPVAISLGISAIFLQDDSQQLEVYTADFDEQVSIDLKTLLVPEGKSRWPLYVTGTLRVLKQQDIPLRGGKVVMKSDLPLGSGLSSSAAIECLFAYMMSPDYFDNNRRTLALLAQKAEREEVGMNCGIMDQYAVAFGKKDMAMLLDCANVESRYIPADFGDYALVIINSNQPRTLADSKYNERRKECDAALEIIQRHDPAKFLVDAHEISIAQLEDDVLYARAKHVVTEQKRVLAALDALEQGNMPYFGELLWASHQSLDEDYEVAGTGLNTIVFYAKKFSGCIGARMTGAGFGGCAIALVEKSRVKRFCDYVGHKYEVDMGVKADFYLAEITDGVRKIG